MLDALFRILLVLWIVGYLVVSCVPMLSGSGVEVAGGTVAGIVFFIPSLVGVMVLSIFVWLTNPRARCPQRISDRLRLRP